MTITGTLSEEVRTFMIIFCRILCRVRNVSEKSCRKNQNTHFRSRNSSESFVIYGIVWKILYSWIGHRWQQYTAVLALCTLENEGYKHTLRILINFPLQQWLRECATVLMLCAHNLFCVSWLLCIQKKGLWCPWIVGTVVVLDTFGKDKYLFASSRNQALIPQLFSLWHGQ